VIAAPYIEPAQLAQTAFKGGRSARGGQGGQGAVLQPEAATGRALATQRDALFFRSEAILLQGGPAQATYLAQQIGQLWPSTPQAANKTASNAYEKGVKTYDPETPQPASITV
jgi:hypothetical protein